MLRKIITVILLAVLMVITVGPFVQITACNMPCCTDLAATCCEPNPEQIFHSSVDCGKIEFTAVISAPIQKKYQQSDLLEFALVLFSDIVQDPGFQVLHEEDTMSYLLSHLNLPLLA